MNWFFIALGAPFLWAIVNIIDNYLVSKFSHKEIEKSSGGLVLFSSLIGLFIAVGVLISVPNIFSIPFFDKLLLFIAGIFTVVWIILYLFALELEDVSNVVPWFLTVPVFGYILGYVFLGEQLKQTQAIGSAAVLLGLILLSVSWNTQNKKINTKAIVYMFLSSLLIAISGVIFKYVTIGNNFWVSSFWEYLGLGVSGLFIYLFIPKYRNDFYFMNKTGGKKIFLLNILSEFMTISGNLLTNFSLLLAPVVMVYLVGAFQPVMVLFLTIVGTIFFPHIIKENISYRNIIPKIIAILFMIFGTFLLFL